MSTRRIKTTAEDITPQAEAQNEPMPPTATPTKGKPKPVGRPVKITTLADIRVKLLEVQEVIGRYNQSCDRPLLLVGRLDRELGRFVRDLRRKDNDQD